MTKMMKTINKKIPGSLPPLLKNELDGKLGDLSAKSMQELLELRDRQIKLLNKKTFISKLPDNGYKIKALHDKIDKEIKARREQEHTCRLLNNMNLEDLGYNYAVQDIEWEGKITCNNITYLDSDDDSEPEDVLNILSRKILDEKKIKVLKPEKASITPEDLLNIGETPYVKNIMEKVGQNIKPKQTGQYKPYKTTKSDVHKPEKEILRKKHKYWEITSATPPPIIHVPTKVLTIEESLKLQQETNMHLKKIEAQYAAEKLIAKAGTKMPELPEDTSKFGYYRSNEDSDESGTETNSEDSDKEVHDDEPERGGVIFTVMK